VPVPDSDGVIDREAPLEGEELRDAPRERDWVRLLVRVATWVTEESSDLEGDGDDPRLAD
jgi:hypothetical protein